MKKTLKPWFSSKHRVFSRLRREDIITGNIGLLQIILYAKVTFTRREFQFTFSYRKFQFTFLKFQCTFSKFQFAFSKFGFAFLNFSLRFEFRFTFLTSVDLFEIPVYFLKSGFTFLNFSLFLLISIYLQLI